MAQPSPLGRSFAEGVSSEVSSDVYTARPAGGAGSFIPLYPKGANGGTAVFICGLYYSCLDRKEQ